MTGPLGGLGEPIGDRDIRVECAQHGQDLPDAAGFGIAGMGLGPVLLPRSGVLNAGG